MATPREIIVSAGAGLPMEPPVTGLPAGARSPFHADRPGNAGGPGAGDAVRPACLPGILVDGVSVNPFDLLIQPACRVDDAKARELFGP